MRYFLRQLSRPHIVPHPLCAYFYRQNGHNFLDLKDDYVSFPSRKRNRAIRKFHSPEQTYCNTYFMGIQGKMIREGIPLRGILTQRHTEYAYIEVKYG